MLIERIHLSNGVTLAYLNAGGAQGAVMVGNAASVSRRDLARLAVGAGVVTAAFATTGRVARADAHATTPARGIVTTHRLGAVTLHNYVAPEASSWVNTHVIETANELHVIDTQMIQGFAAEARAFVDSLGKPIRRVYLSHAHHDHLFGATQFADADFVTSDAVLEEANGFLDSGGYAQRKSRLGDTTAVRMPDGGLATGTTTWDGVEIVISEVTDCEAKSALLFHVPEAGLMIAQDLLYASVHAFPTGNHPNWIAALRTLGATEGLRVVGAGHGLPAAPGAIDDAIAYLTFREEVIGASADADSAIAAIDAAYPAYGAKTLLSFVRLRF